jgi:hypothetical protein
MKHRRKQSTFVTFAVNMPSKDKLLAFGTAHHVERLLLVVHGLFSMYHYFINFQNTVVNMILHNSTSAATTVRSTIRRLREMKEGA